MKKTISLILGNKTSDIMQLCNYKLFKEQKTQTQKNVISTLVQF